jgi:hypothetical protein
MVYVLYYLVFEAIVLYIVVLTCALVASMCGL